MELFFLFIIIFFIVVHAVDARKPNNRTISSDAKSKYAYFRKNNFMTERERVFFQKLKVICGDSLVVFSQVRLSSFLSHKVYGQNYRAALHHINQKSVDFLLCDSRTFRPLIAIELDDRTHDLAERKKRDIEVEAVFKSAKFPLLRTNDVEIDNSELKRKILELLQNQA